MKFRHIFWLIMIGFLIMQFFPIDKTNPEFDASKDFIAMNQPPEQVASILKTTCYDCHSNETKYPWYTEVAPLSWWVKGHIDHGRGNLNFSEFGTYPAKKANHKLEEVFEEVESKKMPLKSYTFIHGEARLSEEDRTVLASYFKELYQSSGGKIEDPKTEDDNGNPGSDDDSDNDEEDDDD